MPDPYRHAADAYSKRGQGAADQRRLEGDALLKAAARLQDVHRGWRPELYRDLESALLYNRRLWTIFAAEAANDATNLPLELRNNIASISVFVFKRSLELMTQPAPEKIEALIDINRNLAAGLLTRPGAGAARQPTLPTASNNMV
jgi:flagellar biosynthesis activator protein FlaF